MSIQIQLRRDTAANWVTYDPILAQGEMGVETDTYKVKLGDGSTDWLTLPYFQYGINEGFNYHFLSSPDQPGGAYIDGTYFYICRYDDHSNDLYNYLSTLQAGSVVLFYLRNGSYYYIIELTSAPTWGGGSYGYWYWSYLVLASNDPLGLFAEGAPLAITTVPMMGIENPLYSDCGCLALHFNSPLYLDNSGYLSVAVDNCTVFVNTLGQLCSAGGGGTYYPCDSICVDGSNNICLCNDIGNGVCAYCYYGTDASGNKGWFYYCYCGSLPAGSPYDIQINECCNFGNICYPWCCSSFLHADGSGGYDWEVISSGTYCTGTAVCVDSNNCINLLYADPFYVDSYNTLNLCYESPLFLDTAHNCALGVAVDAMTIYVNNSGQLAANYPLYNFIYPLSIDGNYWVSLNTACPIYIDTSNDLDLLYNCALGLDTSGNLGVQIDNSTIGINTNNQLYVIPVNSGDGTYSVYNDGLTTGQVTGFTVLNGLITSVTTLP